MLLFYLLVSHQFKLYTVKFIGFLTQKFIYDNNLIKQICEVNNFDICMRKLLWKKCNYAYVSRHEFEDDFYVNI